MWLGALKVISNVIMTSYYHNLNFAR